MRQARKNCGVQIVSEETLDLLPGSVRQALSLFTLSVNESVKAQLIGLQDMKPNNVQRNARNSKRD